VEQRLPFQSARGAEGSFFGRETKRWRYTGIKLSALGDASRATAVLTGVVYR
jgi:hypothetical protein